MIQYFKTSKGKTTYTHPRLNNLKDLYEFIKNDYRPIPGTEDLSNLSDFSKNGFDELNKTLLPYISVSCIYDKMRDVGGSTIIEYKPILLMDLDFEKKIKKFYNDRSKIGTKNWFKIDNLINDIIYQIEKTIPFTLLKRSYSGGLHILIEYNYIEDEPTEKTISDWENIHKNVFNHYYEIFNNLLKTIKNSEKLIKVDDCTKKINQLMIMNYDPNAIYNDFKEDIYSDMIDDIFDMVNDKIYFKQETEDIIQENNEYIENLKYVYENTTDYFKQQITDAVCSRVDHYSFDLFNNLHSLTPENLKIIYGFFKIGYKGSGVPIKTFNDFYKFVDRQNKGASKYGEERFYKKLEYIFGQELLGFPEKIF